MKQANTFFSPTLDERQLAILVGLCVAACHQVLQAPNSALPSKSSTSTIPLSPPPFGPITHGTPTVSDTGHTPGNRAATTGTDLAHELDNQGQNQSNHAVAAEPKLLLTVEEAAHRLSIGRPKMWQLVMRGEVLSVKIGASRRVPTAALVDYVRRLSGELAQSAETQVSREDSGGQCDDRDMKLAGLSNHNNGVHGSFASHGTLPRTGTVSDKTERKEGAV
jgi:excisionase family DNA binding protein